jgi:hypothetical protein
MTHRPSIRRTAALARSGLALAVLTAGLAVGLTGSASAPAAAAARITVVNDRGTAMADSSYRTQLTISGAGFQSIRGGFGGVYLAFGWVKGPGSWQPSRGGITGEDYRYIPDSESASNQGYLRFVAFPGSSTAKEAHATMSPSGGFRVELTVPGPRFQSVDRDGTVHEVDCTKVTCGVITFGAHGVKNARNETFTPVPFGNVYDAAPDQQAETGSSPEDAEAAPEVDTPGTPTRRKGSATAAPVGTPRVATDRTTAQAGHTLAFTGGGFSPGEQVIGVLDDGIAGIGPMIAGASGEVAGLLQLPADIAPGTHELRLTGAASGSRAIERFPVRSAEVATSTVDTTETGDDGLAASRIFLLVAVLVFAAALLALLARLLLRRTRRRPAAPGPQPAVPGGV